MRTAIATAFVMSLAACASAPEGDRAEGPGPMRPLGPDHELDQAAPVDVEDQPLMQAWLAERVAAAKDGVRERVRLPVIRRSGAFGCDCPPHGVAHYTDNGPFYWIDLVDMTSAGMPLDMRTPSDEGGMGWVDGRFTGAVTTYASSDEGGTQVATPVFEVLRFAKRAAADEAVARVVRE